MVIHKKMGVRMTSQGYGFPGVVDIIKLNECDL